MMKIPQVELKGAKPREAPVYFESTEGLVYISFDHERVLLNEEESLDLAKMICCAHGVELP